MITDFKENETRDSAIIYNSVLSQIKMLYAQDPVKAGEFAISAVELVLTGDMSTDDFMIKLALENMKTIAEKNKEKHEKKVKSQEEKRFEEMRLAEIAELYNQGFTQKEIGIKLNIPQQTISYRLRVIKEKYSDLIVYQNTNFTKNTKFTKTDNVNDNDNVNENEKENDLVADATKSQAFYNDWFNF